MDFKSFNQAIQQIADEKGIAKEKIYEAIEMALAAAYKRDYGKRGQIVHAKMDPINGKVTMKQIKIFWLLTYYDQTIHLWLSQFRQA